MLLKAWKIGRPVERDEVNQIGSVSESIAAWKLCKDNKCGPKSLKIYIQMSVYCNQMSLIILIFICKV